ncbi:MAG: hypothetical protein J1F12_03740 [Muribaculaceae bacterium]|nr:hypothetical protein [Muribaculaceae bacterium]
MKTWVYWVLLVVVVSGIVWFGWWLSSVLPVMWSIYITIVLNFTISVYLSYEKHKVNL